MKKIILIFIAVLFFTVGFAQKKENLVKETTFKVEGVCGMCEKRIESAAMRTKGVKLADWNKKTKNLKVVYNSKKISEEEIHKAVADNGHQTTLNPTDSVAYSNLPGCCRYKDGAKCEH